jgi:rRNA maturation endonuclease Nob1
MTLMLIGSITEELVANLKWAVAKVHMKTCEDCGKEIKDKKWAVCEVCRGK